MKLPRFSIANLMLVVGLVAVVLCNIRVAKTGLGRELEGSGFTFLSFALELGLLCLIRSRWKGWRPFWIGFVTFGVAVGITRVGIEEYIEEGSNSLLLIDRYLDSTDKLLESFVFEVLPDSKWQESLSSYLWDERMFALDLAWFIPEVTVALFGGLLTSLFVRRRNGRYQAQASAPASSEAPV